MEQFLNTTVTYYDLVMIFFGYLIALCIRAFIRGMIKGINNN